jgi:hypothetical protein
MSRKTVTSTLFAATIFSAVAPAATLFTFNADTRPIVGTGAPTSLNSMDPSSAATVNNVQTPVGSGDIGFNGGLVGVGGLLYGIGNDNLGNASLFSMGLDGLNLLNVNSDFNVGGGADSVGFQNGLTAVGGVFYAIGVAGDGTESLFQLGTGGTTTALRTLNTFGGTYAGLTYDPDTGLFMGIIVNATNSDFRGDLLVQFGAATGLAVRARLNALDGSTIGTHLGGLVYAGNNTVYDIFTDTTSFTGQLESLDVTGVVSASVLYDTGLPLVENHGIAIANTPEPGTGALVTVLAICGVLVRRRLAS